MLVSSPGQSPHLMPRLLFDAVQPPSRKTPIVVHPGSYSASTLLAFNMLPFEALIQGWADVYERLRECCVSDW